jgi:hypothetical protein
LCASYYRENRKMRPAHRRLAALTALFALSLLSCGREVTGPENGIQYGRSRTAALALDPQMPSLLASLEGAGDVVAFENVWIVLRDEAGVVVLDTLVPFPVGVDSIALSFEFPIPIDAPEAGLPLLLTMAYVNAAGDTVFRGGPAPVVAAPVDSDGAGTAISIPIIYDGVGKDAASVLITPNVDTVVAGTTSSFTAVARDGQNAVIAGTPLLFYTLDSARASVPNVGVGSVTWLHSRGNARIIAALPDGQPSDTAYVHVKLPASLLVLGSGGGQSGTAGVALANPIVVRTLASDSVPVPGVIVTFAVATGGGSLATLVDTSDANGDVSTSWTLGGTVGPQSITATAAGLTGSPLSINGTATAGAPARVDITAAPTTAVAGAAFAPSLSASIRDAGGNLVTTYTGLVTVALDTGANATLSGTTTLNAVGGVATFAGLSIDKVGDWDLYVTSAALIADTAVVAITPAAPAALVFFNQPTSTIAGSQINPNVSVRAIDAFGNNAPAFSGDVTVAIGSGPGGAVLSGTVLRASGSGVAHFDDLSLDLAGNYTLSATSGALTAATSDTFAIAAAGAATLQAVAGNEQTGAAGTTLADSIVVRVLDAFSNPVAGVQVEFTTTSGSFSPDTLVTDASGYARSAWTVGTVAGLRTAKVTSAGVADLNLTATVTAGAATTLVFQTAPDGLMIAGNPAAAAVVEVRDAQGNTVTSYSGYARLSLQTQPVGSTILAGGDSVAFVSGLATFPGLTLDKAGAYRLQFDAGALPALLSDTIIVSAGAADTIVKVSGDAQTGGPSTTLAAPIRVRVFDAFGNPVENVGVTYDVISGDADPAITTVFTDSTGHSETEIVLHGTLGPVVIHAIVAGVNGSPVIFTATIESQVPTSVVLDASPATATAGLSTSAFTVSFEDGLGNPFPTYEDTVRFSVIVGPTGAPTSGTVKKVATAGVATFDDLIFNIRGAYQIRIVGDGVADTAFATVTVTAAGADSIELYAGDGQTGSVTTALLQTLDVRIYDPYGNPQPGVNVSWGIFSGDATLSAPVTVSDTNGYASVTVTLGATTGAVQVQASVGGVGGSPITFNATATAGAAYRLVVETQPAGGVAGDTLAAFSVSARDSVGNLVTDFTGVVNVVVDSGPAGAVLFGPVGVNAIGGIATFDVHFLTLAGVHRLGFTSGGLADTTSNDFTITATAPSVLSLVDGDVQTDTVTRVLDAPVRVRVTDEFNNPIAGHAVAWSIASGDALTSDDTTFTDANGLATTLVTLGDTVGAVTVHATAVGLTGSPVAFTATSTNDVMNGLNVVSGPAGSVAGATIDAYTVRAHDGYGNTIADFNGAVTLSIADGPAAFALGTFAPNAISGFATFSDLQLDVVGNYTLNFNVGAFDIPMLLTVSASAAASLHFSVPPSFSTAGDLLSPISVIARDGFNNVVATFDSAIVAIDSGTAGAVLSGTLARTPVVGVSTFNDLRIDKSGVFRLSASLPGLTSAVSDPFVVAPSVPDSMALVDGDGQTSTIQSALANPMRVMMLDSLGNPVPGVNVNWGVVTGFATLDSAVTETDSLGIATMNLTFGDSVGVVTVDASSGGVSGSPLTFTLGVLNAPASRMVVDVQPTTGVAAVALSPFVVSARDSVLNFAIDFSDVITVAIDSGPVGAVLAGTTGQSTTAGVATFSDLSVSISGDYRLRFTATGLADTLSAILTIEAGAATELLMVDGEAQSDTVTRALNAPLRVQVVDANANPVVGDTVIWAVSSGDASVDVDTAFTDASGIASTTVTLGTTAGDVTITATRDGLTGSPLLFTATAVPDTMTQLVVTASPDTVIAGNSTGDYTLEARDAYGNVVTDCNCPVTANIEVGASPTFASGTTEVNATAGVVTFSDLVYGTAGEYYLRFDLGAFSANATTTVNAGSAVLFSIIGGDAQTQLAGLGLEQLLAVKISDAQGNGVAGDTVIFTVTSGDGNIEGATADTVLTDANGEAYAAWTLGAALGSQTLSAVNPLLGTQNFSATATEPLANKVWTGNFDTDWNQTSNWNDGIVPTNADSVYIPAGRANYPVLTGNVGMSRLTIASGGSIDMNGSDVLVFGSIFVPSSPAFTNGGAVYANGDSGTVQGAFPSLGIQNGVYTASGTIETASTLRAFNNGRINFAGYTHHILTDFITQSGGTFSQLGEGTVNVYGNAEFGGGSTAGLLANGLLVLRGNVTTTTSTAFMADSTHTTMFTGPTAHAISLFEADTSLSMSCSSSCFGRVTAQKGGGPGLQFLTSAKSLGGFDVNVDSIGGENITLVTGAESNYNVAAINAARFVSKGGINNFGTFNPDTLVLWGNGGTVAFGDVPTIVVGTATIGGAQVMNAPIFVEGTLDVDGQASSGSTLTTRGFGRLTMTDASDSLYVGGTFTANGNIFADTTLTAGLLQLGADLVQDSVINAGFRAGPAHTTHFAVGGPTIAFTGSTANLLGRLSISSGTGLSFNATMITIAGDVVFEGTAGGQINEDAPLTVRLFGSLVDSAASPRWQISTTNLYGVNPTLPTAFIGALVVHDSLTLFDSLHVAQGLQLNDGATLSLGGNKLVVQNNFSMVGSSWLVMDKAADSLITDNASFDGAGTTLTGGYLQVSGVFSQGTNAAAFTGTPDHETWLTGESGGTVVFANPGFGAGTSHFGTLYLAKTLGAPVTVTSDVYVNGKLESGGPPPFNLNGTGQKIVSLGAELHDVVFGGVRWHLLDGQPVDSILNVSFSAQDADSVQFYIERTSGTIDLINPNFFTPPTSGRYLEISDIDGFGDLFLNVVTPNPQFHGGLAIGTGSATILGWLDFPALNWSNGGGDRDWFNPLNWTEGRSPTATDSVFISGFYEGAQMPQITTTAAVRSVVSQSASPIEVQFGLTISERLITPQGYTGVTCPTSNGALFIQGDTTTLAGRFTCALHIDNNVTLLDEELYADTLDLQNASKLVVGVYPIVVNEDFRTQNTATIEMQTPGADLWLRGTSTFGGGASTVTEGVVRVSGSFQQIGTGTFTSSANSSFQTIYDPTYTASSLFFQDTLTAGLQNLYVDAPLSVNSYIPIAANVYLDTLANVFGTGRLVVGTDFGGSPTATVGALAALHVGGTFAFPGSYGADTTVFTGGATQSIPLEVSGSAVTYESIRVTGTAELVGAPSNTYTMNGDLVIEGLLASFGTGVMVVNGNLRTTGNGALSMQNASAELHVHGNATFDGGSTMGQLTDGTLRVYGDFVQDTTNSIASFVGSSNHTVLFDSTGVVRFADTTGTSRFLTLRLNSHPGTRWLESDVRAVVFEVDGEVDTVRVEASPLLGGATPRIRASVWSFNQEIALHNVGLLSTNSWSNGASITFSDFANSPAPQLEIQAATGNLVSGVIGFDSTQTTPLYVRLVDTDGSGVSPGDTLLFTVGGQVTPVIHGGNVDLVGGALLPDWASDPEFRWTGNVNSDWATPGNWATGIVPTSSDSAYVPATVTNPPVISVATDIYKLVSDLVADSIRVEATLGIGDLLVLPRERRLYCAESGEVWFGAIVNASVEGTVGCLVVANAGTLSPTDSAAVDQLVVQADARLIVGTNDTLTVLGAFQTTATGQLQMNDASALMTVYGEATFGGGSVDGLLNFGRLRLNRGLAVTVAGAFIGSNAHTTEFIDEGEGSTPIISFSDPANQRFNNVLFSAGDRNTTTRMVALGNVTINTGVSVAGGSGTSLELLNVGTLTIQAGGSLTVQNAHIPFAISVNGNYDADTTHFTGAVASVAPAYKPDNTALAYDNIVVHGDWSFYEFDTTAVYNVGGSFIVQDSGIARFGSATQQTVVQIAGHFMTTDSARVQMIHANTGILVEQNAVFNGASTAGLLTAGMLSVKGDFGQGGHVEAYSADPGHITSFEGAAAQTVTFAAPGSFGNSSHFGDWRLRPTGGGMSLSLGNSVVAMGQIISDTTLSFPATISSAGTQYVSSYGGHVIGGLTFDNVHWTIFNGQPLDTLESLTFTNISADTLQLRIAREDGLIELIQPTFSTAGTNAFFRVTDGGGVSPLTVNVTAPQPPFHNLRAEAEFGAIINGWSQDPEFVWTGAINQDWLTAGNWSMGVVPTGTDSAFVPSTATVSPTLSDTTASIRALVVESIAQPVSLLGIAQLWVSQQLSTPIAGPGFYCDSSSAWVGLNPGTGNTLALSGNYSA